MSSANHRCSTDNYQNLFVAKLPMSVTDNELKQVFAEFSPQSATVMLDALSGRSKGYGFVLFDSEKRGREAAAALDKTTASVTRAGGVVFTFALTIFPSKHSGREVAVENECLYIRNIPNSWPMEQVEAFIAQHGKPVYSAVRSDHHGSPVWVVFVEYDTVESARATLKAVHGMRVTPNSPPILAKFAESEEVKKNRRERKTGGAKGHGKKDTKAPSSVSSASSSNPPATAANKRRVVTDATHQLHRPCHATRYGEDGEVLYSEDTPQNIVTPSTSGGKCAKSCSGKGKRTLRAHASFPNDLLPTAAGAKLVVDRALSDASTLACAESEKHRVNNTHTIATNPLHQSQGNHHPHHAWQQPTVQSVSPAAFPPFNVVEVPERQHQPTGGSFVVSAAAPTMASYEFEYATPSTYTHATTTEPCFVRPATAVRHQDEFCVEPEAHLPLNSLVQHVDGGCSKPSPSPCCYNSDSHSSNAYLYHHDDAKKLAVVVDSESFHDLSCSASSTAHRSPSCSESLCAPRVDSMREPNRMCCCSACVLGSSSSSHESVIAGNVAKHHGVARSPTGRYRHNPYSCQTTIICCGGASL